MSNDYGFNSWRDSSSWETDERKIFQNTCSLCDELNTHKDGLKTYYDIVGMFKRCNQNGISNLLADLYKRQKEDGQLIDRYAKQVEELNKQLIQISGQLRHTSVQLENLHDYGLDEKFNRAREMKNLYEKGTSLREIGRVFHCDKSTVKRMLIKMGVQIRNEVGTKTHHI